MTDPYRIGSNANSLRWYMLSLGLEVALISWSTVVVIANYFNAPDMGIQWGFYLGVGFGVVIDNARRLSTYFRNSKARRIFFLMALSGMWALVALSPTGLALALAYFYDDCLGGVCEKEPQQVLGGAAVIFGVLSLPAAVNLARFLRSRSWAMIREASERGPG